MRHPTTTKTRETPDTALEGARALRRDLPEEGYISVAYIRSQLDRIIAAHTAAGENHGGRAA